jgi:hypothetical protein
MDTRAADIARSLLTITERALFDDNFSAFLAVTALPFEVETYDGKLVLRTEGELEGAFRSVVDSNAALNITGYQRDLVSAQFTAADEVKYAYVTRVLSGAMLAESAYPNIAMARSTGGVWKIALAQHAKQNAPEYQQIFGGLGLAHM